MELSKAWTIFQNIQDDQWTDEEKGLAILTVLEAPTHNSVSKTQMLDVIRYLLPLAFEIPGVSPPEDGGWISVDEDMPEEEPVPDRLQIYGNKTVSDDVLVTIYDEDTGKFFVDQTWTINGTWMVPNIETMKVTHWMPYPAPAKGFTKEINDAVKSLADNIRPQIPGILQVPPEILGEEYK